MKSKLIESSKLIFLSLFFVSLLSVTSSTIVAKEIKQEGVIKPKKLTKEEKRAIKKAQIIAAEKNSKRANKIKGVK